MEFDATEFKNTQQKLKEMIEINNKNSKNGIWKWNEIALAAMFIEDAVKNNGDSAITIEDRAYWIAIRLKFTTPEIDNLIIGYLNGERNYTYQLYDRTIYQWMHDCRQPYPEAILSAYIHNISWEERKKYGYYYPTPYRYLGKLGDTKLLEDGKTIIPCERVSPLDMETEKEKQARIQRNKKAFEDFINEMSAKKGMTAKQYKKLAFGNENYEGDFS